MADLLDASPCLVRIAGTTVLGAELLAGLEGPVVALLGHHALPQHVVQLQQVGDVGGRVGELGRPERSTQPVGEAVRLGRAHLQLPLEQGRQRGARVAEEAGEQLGVDQPGRDGPTGSLEHLHVLARRVHDGEARPVQHLRERREVHGERVDHRDAVRVGDLHDGDVGEVGALAVELGVDRVLVLVDQAVDEATEGLVVLDQLVLDAPGSGHGLSRARTPSRRGAPPRSRPSCHP